ncbi:hypothetical protein RHECNPAF_430029 [Rhizobium etli CNPAF512]|nr:hypothetical protein RHECNPAF_430029 [Rhizobium etli CNPAF512]
MSVTLSSIVPVEGRGSEQGNVAAAVLLDLCISQDCGPVASQHISSLSHGRRRTSG